MKAIVIVALVVVVLFFIFEKRKKINITTPKIPWKKILWIVFILGIIIIGVYYFSSNNSSSNNSYPTSGKGIATKENPIKAYLDPQKTYTRTPTKAKFIFEKDENIFFICGKKENSSQEYINSWAVMPKGNYLIFPLPPETEIVFEWGQGKKDK